MRIMFIGTPDFAVPFLDEVCRNNDIVAVVTKPDRPFGRGYKLKASPVKEACIKYGFKLYQPEKIKDISFIKSVEKLNIDLIIVVAYGQILTRALLQLPEIGSINVHFSFLPEFRGPDPIRHAIMSGGKETGVSTFWMDEKVDCGKIILQDRVIIEDDDNYLSLRDKLVEVGRKILNKTIDLIVQNKAQGSIQQPEGSSYAPFIDKRDMKINWDTDCRQVYNFVRALSPFPASFTMVRGKKLKILNAAPVEKLKSDEGLSFMPGQIVEFIKHEGFIVKCKRGYLLIRRVQIESKKSVDANDFLQGHTLRIGEKLG